MRQSYIAAGSTRDPLFFYSFAAVLYLLLTYLSMKLINRLEARYSRGILMDFDLMFTSFPKLLGATVVTLKLLSVSLFFGLFIGLLFAILRLNKNIFINKFAYGYSYLFRGNTFIGSNFHHLLWFGDKLNI
jgi:ABC-type arginine transport system permease subunit